MSKLKIGIIEDELVIAETIRETLLDLGYEVTEAAINFTQGLELVEKEKPDLILLDIVLSGSKDGIDLAHEIRKNYNLPIVFLTSNSDSSTVNRAKEIAPEGYLVKPFNKEDLFTTIEIAISKFEKQVKKSSSQNNDSAGLFSEIIFIKQDSTYHKVKFDDIIYIQSDHVYVEIFTVNQKFLVRSSLGNFIKKLPSNLFFQIQRSCVINLKHLKAINHSCAIVGTNSLPIGKTFRDELMKIVNIE